MYAIIRHSKLHTIGNIRASGEHTFRERETLNADPNLSHLNQHYLAKNTDELVANIEAKLPEKVRKNGVICLEYLVTASPEFFATKTREETIDYFRQSISWLKQRHGEENIAYFGLQMDETTPHLVAYVVPIDPKGKLNARHFTGGREKLSEYQDSFAKAVERFGLKRGIKGSKAKHQDVKRHYAMINHSVTVPRNEADLMAGYAQAVALRAENERLKAQIEALKPKPIEKWKSKATERTDFDPFSDAPKTQNKAPTSDFVDNAHSTSLTDTPKPPRRRF